MVRFSPKDPGKYRVKSTHPQVLGIRANHVLQTLAHFFCCLVGEGEGHDVKRINMLALDQVSNAKREYTGFAGTSSRYDHAGTIGIHHAFTLRLVQAI